MKLKCGDSISSRSFLISASAMHLRDATEWSEQASEDWWPFAILPCSLTPSRSPADSGRVHACFRHCGGLHHRTQYPHPLLPPSFLRRPLDYGKRREGLRRSGGRTRTVGRIEGGSRRECGVPCRRGFTCSAFFREAARSKETSRGRPRGRGRPTVNSIPGRRVRQWAGAGAIER